MKKIALDTCIYRPARMRCCQTMKVIRQPHTLKIHNLDVEQKKVSRHGHLLPPSIRCIISGPSGCGKTNVMISLLTEPNGLRYENVYVYSKSLYQPKYQFLRDVLNGIKGIGYYQYSDSEDVIDPSEAKSDSVFIFDDISTDRHQQIIQSYFSFGRHRDVDAFYLCQTYSRIPKQLIRDNANMIVIFKMDDMNLKHIYDNHVNNDFTYHRFKELCSECWKDKYGFLTIVKDWEGCGRYRKGFDHYISV